jgi:translation initiation factor 5A
MEKKVAEVSSLKVGSYVIINGAACRVSSIQISRPGKHGHAKFRIIASGLIDGKKRDLVMPHGNVDVPIIDKRNAQVLSVHGDAANVMDSETYETFDLKIPDELKDKVAAGSQVVYWKILNDRVMKQIKGE